MIRLRQSGVDEILIKRIRDWYDPGPGVFIQSLTTALFSPAMLFTGSITGGWYDPSDFSTMFQDAAGTTPVTAVGQPVGRILDKSGRGNLAYNPSGNSANFPVLSARYNLLTKTEQFDDATVWERSSGNGGSVPVATPDYEAGPFAKTLADRVQLVRTTQTGSFSQLSVLMTPLLTAGVTYIASVWMKSRSGSVVVDMGSFNGAYGNYKPTVTTEWQRFSYQWTVTSTTSRFGPLLFQTTGTSETADLLIWGADLRIANDALNQPAYQRVNTSSDYDTVGFKQGEVFDGINDYLTASAGGGSTTSFFWCSAIRVGKVGAVQTLFSDAGTKTGYRVRINASNQLELSAGNGTSYTTVSTTATLSIGQRSVLTAWHDGTNLNVQINNGTVHQVAFAAATAGTAQFTIGKDNNAASNFFAGWLYEKVYTKDNVPSVAQIADTKAYVANIAGITL